MAWVWLVLLYGILKGVRDIAKKKALKTNSVLNVLFFYTLVSFALVTPGAGEAMNTPAPEIGYTAIKSFVIFIGWMCGFYALEKMPVSLYGVIDLSQMLFATLLGVVFLGERMTALQVAGLVLVTGGLLMLRVCDRSGRLKGEGVTAKLVGMALVCCLMNGISGTMDKVLMRSMTSAQLQFWYMFFLTVFYALYMLIRRIPMDWRGVVRNPWIWLISIVFVIGDRALFVANGMESSRVTVMTLVKQSSCVVAILGGRLVFKEGNTLFKLMCAAVVIAGIVVAVL